LFDGITLTGLLLPLAACEESTAVSTIIPSEWAPLPTTDIHPTTAGFQPTRGPHVFTGVITEITAAGVRPSARAYINAWIQLEQSGYSYWWANGPVFADAEGRFALGMLPAGAKAQLQVGKDGYVQQCAAPLLNIEGSGTVDAHLVARDMLSASASIPSEPGFRTLSGVVYRTTASGGREPVAGAWVGYEPFMDYTAAHTSTDAEGRYALCGLPDSNVHLVVGSSGRVEEVSVAPGRSGGVDILLR
jgi:hypothetical protein